MSSFSDIFTTIKVFGKILVVLAILPLYVFIRETIGD